MTLTRCLSSVSGIAKADRRAVLARTVELRKTMPQQQAAAQAVREALDAMPGVKPKQATRAVLFEQKEQITQAQTETPAFRAWFGDSKVVGADGKPLMFYHGGSGAFSGLRPGGKFGGAIFVRQGAPSGYGEETALYVKGPILELQEMRRLLDGETGRALLEKAINKKLDDNEAEELVEELTNGAHYPTEQRVQDLIGAIDDADAQVEIQKLRGDVAKGLGFGAVRTPDEFDGETVMILRPEQIKSAIGNRGTFDPNDPNILYQKEGAARGSYSPIEKLIIILDNANASTFLHESAHFYLDTLTQIAADLVRRESQLGETLTAGEKEIVADVDLALKDMKIVGNDTQSAIDQWALMTPDQQREGHERWARGYERYLLEGKAPSLELQPLFARFRSWMVNIYKTLRGLNVPLSDEVRGIFDRMLASTEAIEKAQSVREMGALFTEQTKSGMTAEQWAEYQKLGEARVQAAEHELDTRLLKDMKWLRRTHGKAMATEKRRVAGLRQEVEQEVRAEIMRQPVYRVWQFLTGKGEVDQRAPAADKEKASRALDPSKDSLFTAIAKLGGLQVKNVTGLWGLKWGGERIAQPVFGMPVIRKSGGKTVEAMAEALAEAGYIALDENQRYEVTDFEEKFASEARGDTQYSIAKQYGEREVDALDTEQFSHGKLDTQSVKEMYPEEWKVLSDRSMLSPSGSLPEQVAKTYGMTGAREMIDTLLSAPHPQDVIDAITDREMMDRYGDIASSEALNLAADEAVHNEAAERMLAIESAALDKATAPGKANLIAQAASQHAADSIAQVRIRDLNPAKYGAAEARAAREATKAFRSGDIAAAAKAKRTQVINAAATREALAAKAEVDKGVKYMKRMLQKPPGVELEYWKQIAALLEGYELGKVTGVEFDRAESLSAWVAGQEALMRDTGIDPALMEQARSYVGLTVEEFRGLVDSIKSIEHLGRLKRKLMLSNREADFEVQRDAIVAKLAEKKGGKERDTVNTYAELARRGIGKFAAEHRKFASLALEADGFDYGGPMTVALTHSMNTSGATEAGMRNDATKRLWAILKPIMKFGGVSGHSQKYSFGTFSQEQRMGMLFNWGNAGNKQRLLDGRNFTEAQIKEVIDSMPKAELDAAQAVWDFFESYRPQIQQMEKETYNREPKWIEPLAFETKHGVYRGGYFPAVYDTQLSDRSEQLDAAEETKRQMSGVGMAAATRRGYVKARSEKVKRPILLTMDGLWRGTNEVIHDLAWRRWVMDANALLNDKEVVAGIRDTMGPEKLAVMRETVRDIAAMSDVANRQVEKVFRHFRVGTVVSSLGLNIAYNLINLTGFSQSSARIGVTNVLYGVGKWLSSPVGAVKEMHDKSEQMRLRALTLNREVNEIRSAMLGRGTGKAAFDRIMFFPTVATQLAVDTPTWWGAYHKAQGEGQNDSVSVAMADQAVLDSQSGGQTKDLAAVQRSSEAFKLLTVFYGYWNATWNLTVEKTKATSFTSPVQVAALARDYMLLYAVPALFAVVVRDALSDGDDDDFWKKVAAESLSGLFGTFVGVRETAAMVKYQIAKALGDESARSFGYGGPAGMRFFSELTKFGEQSAQGEADTAFRRAAVNVTGIALHLPGTQLNRSLDGFVAWHEGDASAAAMLFGKPKN